jgi:hypothetical protein
LAVVVTVAKGYDLGYIWETQVGCSSGCVQGVEVLASARIETLTCSTATPGASTSYRPETNCGPGPPQSRCSAGRARLIRVG